MKLHSQLDDAAFAQLVEYASGALSGEALTAMEGHLQGCATCANALTWLRPLAGVLSSDPAPVELPDGGAAVWDRIAERLEDSASVQPWKGWSDSAAASQLVRDATETEWSRTAIEGIDVRKLSVDRESSTMTMLIRMQPGTSYPAHEHRGPEECYVLEGDLVIGDELEMRGGDFQRMESGTVHPEQRTEGGCLLLLRSSLDDRLLAG